LHDVGVALPGQMSLVGFDDIPMARCYHPSLTTIRQHYDKMAAAAVDILERRLGGDEMPRTQQMIAPSLVVRESTVAV
jgi:DNA-binding LacI/PurR family transcriptional regulator